MERQSQNPEFRIIPENFHPCILNVKIDSSQTLIIVPLWHNKELIRLWGSNFQGLDQEGGKGLCAFVSRVGLLPLRRIVQVPLRCTSILHR